MFFRLLLTVILAATTAVAQRGGGGRGGGAGDMPSMPVAGASRLDIISETLQLNKEQKKFVKTTLDQAQKESAPVRKQLIKSHEEIGEAIRDARSPEEIDGLVKSHAAVEAHMARIEVEAFAKIFLKLDETQQEKSGSLFQMMKGIFSEKNWNEIQ
jgi:hypothetical protein